MEAARRGLLGHGANGGAQVNELQAAAFLVSEEEKVRKRNRRMRQVQQGLLMPPQVPRQPVLRTDTASNATQQMTQNDTYGDIKGQTDEDNDRLQGDINTATETLSRADIKRDK